MAGEKFIGDLKAMYASWGRGMFDSVLEVPDGRDPNQNAWLTIKLRIRILFADGAHPYGKIYRDGSYYYIKDSDKTEYRVQDWDAKSIDAFKRDYLKGEQVWNHKYTLITPDNVNAIDYESMQGTGWHVRPNVKCLFRLAIDNVDYHRTVLVVRIHTTTWEDIRDFFTNGDFRSNWELYQSADVNPDVQTLGHELGHAINQDHIAGLMGDETCKLRSDTGNERDCYGKNAIQCANIMGMGKDLGLVNAISWLNRITQHTGTEAQISSWKITMDMNTPPRKIPLGVMLVAPPRIY